MKTSANKTNDTYPTDIIMDTKIPLDTPTDHHSSNFDGTYMVKGDSMSPELHSGDIVCYKNVNSCSGELLYGRIYVVAYVEDGEERMVVKYVDESEKHGYYTLRSANPNYESWDIPRDSVRHLGLVKTSVRLYTT